MTKPVLSRRVANPGRRYTHPITGEAVPSVTTITGMKDKSGPLVGWAVKETTEYVVKNWDELAVMSDTNKRKIIKGARFEAKAAGTDDTAADLGTNVHQAIEDRILGRPVTLAKDSRGFLEQFDNFCDRYQPEWTMVERTVWNRTLGYAGTLDGAGTFGQDKVNLLVDFKSGNGVYAEYFLQLEALARGEFAIGPDGKEIAIPPYDKLTVLHLRPDFWELYSVREESREGNWEAFQALLTVYNWDQGSHLAFGAQVRGGVDIEELL